MKLFLSAIKDQVNILTLLMAFFLLACLLMKLKRRRPAIRLLVADLVIFLLVSTAYLPEYLAERLERQYAPFNANNLKVGKERIYIHVLGSGYSLDSVLPATARLGLTAQGRLAEGIRLFRQIDNSILVTSAGSLRNMETQAALARKAAILLGVDSSRIITLNTPNTTLEEAAAMVKLVGVNATVIVVTDAIHMPRAMKFFRIAGLVPLAAPTNFRIHKEVMGLGIKWWPSLGNIGLMDIVVHEWLGNLKAGL
jgi:uncharacterized SAM-binding protein YcdF (DUF218 family)